MAYSDKDLMVSTQIAYYDVSSRLAESERTIGFIIKSDRENNEGTYKQVFEQMNKAEKEHGTDSLQYKRFKETLDMYDSIADGKDGYEKYSSWKVVSVKDDNTNSGFYGCLIETDKDNAIVAYRGSESTDNEIMPEKGNQTLKDWGKADFGLLNSVSTEQQEVGREYLLEIMEEGKYKNYVGAGHSLGDNLMTDSYLYLPKEYRDKMSVFGFDGPNFSEEYVAELKEYYKENGWSLEEAAGNITHYQWSLVGAIFQGNLPGINFKTVRTTDDVYGSLGWSALTQKHAVVNLKFDENGNLIEGKMDLLAMFAAVLTNGIDAGTHTSILPDIIIAVLGGNKKEKIALVTVLISLVSTLGISGTLIGALGIIIGFSKIGISDMFYENVISVFLENLKSDVKSAIDRLRSDIEKAVKKTFEFLKAAQNTINKFLSSVKTVLGKLEEWAFRNSAGYKYASDNTYIQINTNKMNDYAAQLRALSARSKSLDRRMNSLYFHAGFDWNTARSVSTLGNLLKAEVVLDFAGRLDKCASYLEQTASEFNCVERELIAYSG